MNEKEQDEHYNTKMSIDKINNEDNISIEESPQYT